MSKKQLLTESEIRRFMKLANLEPLAKNVVREGYAQQDEGMPASATDEQIMKEVGLSGDDSPPEAVKPAIDAPEEGGEDTGDALKKLSPETKEKVMQLIAADLGVDVSELDLELDGEGEEDMDMEMSDEDEGDEDEGDEEEEEEEEEKDEMDETLSEDALVETVLARVTARLVAEASKKKMPKGLKDAMKKKQQEKEAKKEKPAAKKESLELKGDKLEEATSAEGGGPLLKQGKNKYDVYKGHADMTMAKGDKGGKGGHSLETLSAKAEHTVTHGGKNLATLGGNKKKV